MRGEVPEDFPGRSGHTGEEGKWDNSGSRRRFTSNYSWLIGTTGEDSVIATNSKEIAQHLKLKFQPATSHYKTEQQGQHSVKHGSPTGKQSLAKGGGGEGVEGGVSHVVLS